MPKLIGTAWSSLYRLIGKNGWFTQLAFRLRSLPLEKSLRLRSGRCIYLLMIFIDCNLLRMFYLHSIGALQQSLPDLRFVCPVPFSTSRPN